MRAAIHLAIGCAALLAGCQTAEQSAPDQSNAAYELSTRLAAAIGRCWFAATDPLFPDYNYSPERNADQSRILIVPRANPTALPLLVVEPKSGNSADVYGPLLGTTDGPRLASDVARWARGDERCAA